MLRPDRMPPSRRLQVLIVVAGLSMIVLLATPGPAQLNQYLIDTGPLRIRDQFFLSMGFLAFDPVSADVLRAGEWQLDLVATVTNDFARSEAVGRELEARSERQPVTLEQLRVIGPNNGDSGIFLVDGELYRSAFAVRRGFGKGVQLELVVPLLSFQGGVVDSLIEGFHDTFGFDQVGRLGLPRDSFTVYTRSAKGELYIDEDPGLALGDIVLGAKFRLLKGSHERPFRLGLETLLKLPTGDGEPLVTSGSADFGTQLLATRYFSKSCLHGSVGALRLGASDRLGVDSQTLFSGMLAYERAFGLSTTGLIQVTISESPFGDLDLSDLDRTSLQATLGVKRAMGRQVLFIGLTENLANFNNTPDVGFHLGLTRSFGRSKPKQSLTSGEEHDGNGGPDPAPALREQGNRWKN